MVAPRKPDRFVLLGQAHKAAIELEKQIVGSSQFQFQAEVKRLNAMLGTVAELDLAVRRFELSRKRIATEATPEFKDYLRQINELGPARRHAIELHDIELSLDFKTFLLLAKATLDKAVPLYSNRFHDGLRQFENKGTKLLQCVKRNKKVTAPQQFVELLTKAKKQWIDDLIGLRDEYAHYSQLPEYRNFELAPGVYPVTSIEDFTPATIEVRGVRRDALAYMTEVRLELVKFLRDFISLCGFTRERTPNTYFKCDNCGKPFADRKNGKVRLLRDCEYGSPTNIGHSTTTMDSSFARTAATKPRPIWTSGARRALF